MHAHRIALDLVRGDRRRRQVAAHADGVVVGSALVNCIRDNLGERTQIAPVLAAKAAELAAGVTRV